ncbi:BET1 [Panicum miliaceum]|uniref:BET1 n=1 Tax=Panicum miliaceum TaxID=4540 RepID=A0A3L6PNP9_PANMI|nr:BET1 [Panicum miliaceum]
MVSPMRLPASSQSRGWLLKLPISQAPSNAQWGKEAPKEGGSPTNAATNNQAERMKKKKGAQKKSSPDPGCINQSRAEQRHGRREMRSPTGHRCLRVCGRWLAAARLTGDIHEEVENHNRMLDRMGNDMDASRGFLSGTVDRFKMVFETKSSRRMATMVASFIAVFLLIYYLTK